MLLKGVLIVCIQAVLIKAIVCQCIGPSLLAVEPIYSNYPNNFALCGAVPMPAPVTRIVGANLVVDTSAMEPSGVSIFSDNLFIEGTVLVSGNLPFLSTVALQGVVPDMGRSAVSYGCGNGNIGITSDVPLAYIPQNVLGVGLAGGINRCI